MKDLCHGKQREDVKPGNSLASEQDQCAPKCLLHISFPIVPNRLFSGGTKNNRHFGYPETKITNFKISGTRLGTTLRYCRLILETETEPGMKSRFHYLCPWCPWCFVLFGTPNYTDQISKNYSNCQPEDAYLVKLIAK